MREIGRTKHGAVSVALAALAVALGACHLHRSDRPIHEPQEVYPEFTLEAQRKAQKRLERHLAKERIAGLRETTPPALWIAYAYHGMLLDANREVIEIEDKTVELMQESAFEMLVEQIPAGSPVVGQLEAIFHADVSGPDRLIARKAAVCWAVSHFDQPPSNLVWRERSLRSAAEQLVDWENYTIDPALLALFERVAIPTECFLPTPGAAYVAECRDQGVPIPPDWPSSQWVSQGELAVRFVSAGLSAEVFAYRDPRDPTDAENPGIPGVCIALPRRNGPFIWFLGIICQSDRTGKACFWDNVDANGNKIRESEQNPVIQLDIDRIRNGSNLRENCTQCHRGYNAFMIHPGTALDLPAPYDTESEVRYSPIGQSHWDNPQLTLPPLETGQMPCTRCHEIADTISEDPVRKGYCKVLENAALQTMPPFGAAGWPPPEDSDYRQHLEFLRNRCL